MENIFLGAIFSFVLTFLLLPPLIRMAKVRELFVPTNYRKVHNNEVSALGGLAIFSSVLISFLLFVDAVNFPDVRYVVAMGLLMFFVGLRDDFHPVSVRTKLISQLMAVTVLVFLADIQIDFFSHFIDGGVGGFIDSLATIFIMLWVINAFNFIDGIDLLASLYAFIVFTILGIWFLLTDQYDYSLMLLSLSGAFMAFMIFNYSPSKIFMGDTGTLSVGLLLAITLLKFDDVNTLIAGSQYEFHNAPGLAFGFISIPFVDSIRVATLRIFRGVSPFKADKNHIHHLFLRLGWKQNQVAIFLGFIIILIIGINFILDYFYISSLGIIFIDLLIILAMYLMLFKALNKIGKLSYS
jgi:UDP-N-acetylmuramyl pentapeptide phosphotransferase/UDP-N-acetylglucosamine-1-phosphate transferase